MAGKWWAFRVFPGINRRILQRIAELGYRRENGEPNIPAFLAAHPHYDRTSFYKFIHEARPVFPATHLETLARDLQVTRGWLCFGDEPSWRQTVASLMVALALLWPAVASGRDSAQSAMLPVVTLAARTRRHPPYQKLRALLSWLTGWWPTRPARPAWA